MKRYDVIIIGTGPAAISAAITLSVREKEFLLIGNKNLSMKIEKAHTILNYPGLPEISGQDLRDAFQKHLDQMGIQVTEDRIVTAFAMGSYFAVQGVKDNYEANAIIIATGANLGKALPGELEYLGRGVSYCATCDAPLYKGKSTLIVAYSKEEETEAAFMAELADRVIYMPQYEDVVELSDGIEIVKDQPMAIEGGFKANTLITKGGRYDVDGIFLLRESVSPAQLVPGLEMDGNHIAVNRKLETNLKGCFACGDITGTPYQYIKAAGEGNVAALSAVKYLTELEKIRE